MNSMVIETQDSASELVIALVAPLGTDLKKVIDPIEEKLKLFQYTPYRIKLSSMLEYYASDLGIELKYSPEADRIKTHMNAGNKLREKIGRGDALALLAVQEIARLRGTDQPVPGNAYILDSLKHPDEIALLRTIYDPTVYIIGVHASEQLRLEFLNGSKNVEEDTAMHLMERDEAEDIELGQRTRDTFHLSDAFISLYKDTKSQIYRVMELLFSNPHITPTRDEFYMNIAFAASLRSGDLSRQVGSAIVSQTGDVIAVGANDAPRAGGTHYWEEDTIKHRDIDKGFDSNRLERDKIVVKVMKALELVDENEEDSSIAQRAEDKLKNTGLMDLTEYGRAVHAEMDALMSCSKIGVSTLGGKLYCTTFPCHNCAKHLVAAGITEVIYVEPYPKSKALELHSDSVVVDTPECEMKEQNKMIFRPFVGIGPRHFMDLFSLRLGSGYNLKRAEDGFKLEWLNELSVLRTKLPYINYIEKEERMIAFFRKVWNEKQTT